MNILKKWEKHLSQKVLTVSSVWNYHNSGSYSELIKNKRSNLRESIVSLLKDNKINKGISIIVGRKGRSTHSMTDILIFDMRDDNMFTNFTKEELIDLI